MSTSKTIEQMFWRAVYCGVHPVRICEIYGMTPAQLQARIETRAGVAPGRPARGTAVAWRRLFEKRSGAL